MRFDIAVCGDREIQGSGIVGNTEYNWICYVSIGFFGAGFEGD
jgi:hypothetical protein